MPKFTMNDEGQLVGEDGKPFQVDGEAVTVEGVKTQATFDHELQNRIGRETKKVDDLKAQIATLDKQTEKSAEMEGVITSLRTQLEEANTEKNAAEQAATAKTAEQNKKLLDRAEKAEGSFADLSTKYAREKLERSIIGVAGDTFINPVVDIAPRLANAHKREPLVGADGKQIEGQFQDLFEVGVANEEGERTPQYVPLDKAIAELATDPAFAHYRRGTGASGAGTQIGNKTPPGTMKRSQLKGPAGHVAFIKQYGEDAYAALAV